MNKEIKELAEEAGLVNTWGGWVSTQEKHAEGVSDDALTKFYEMAFRAGGERPWWSVTQAQLQALIKHHEHHGMNKNDGI
jgi:hypothetical protein